MEMRDGNPECALQKDQRRSHAESAARCPPSTKSAPISPDGWVCQIFQPACLLDDAVEAGIPDLYLPEVYD